MWAVFKKVPIRVQGCRFQVDLCPIHLFIYSGCCAHDSPAEAAGRCLCNWNHVTMQFQYQGRFQQIMDKKNKAT